MTLNSKNIQEIYSYFQIPPGLQRHMYIVTTVGKYICDSWQGPPINKQAIITALLLHDLGNLIKFDLSENAIILDPVLHEPAWRGIQRKLIKKYGTSAHKATLKMAKEIITDSLVLELIDGMDATNLEKIFQKSLEHQICEYADMRVIPDGISSLEKRLTDIHDRYQHLSPDWADKELFIKNKIFGKKIEDSLQQNTTKNIIFIPQRKIDSYLIELPQYIIKKDN